MIFEIIEKNISFAAGEKQRRSSQPRLSRPVCKYTRNQNLVIIYTEKQQQRDSSRLCLLTASNRKEEPASLYKTYIITMDLWS